MAPLRIGELLAAARRPRLAPTRRGRGWRALTTRETRRPRRTGVIGSYVPLSISALTSGYDDPRVSGRGRLILVCDDGSQPSLAAATLLDLGWTTTIGGQRVGCAGRRSSQIPADARLAAERGEAGPWSPNLLGGDRRGRPRASRSSPRPRRPCRPSGRLAWRADGAALATADAAARAATGLAERAVDLVEDQRRDDRRDRDAEDRARDAGDLQPDEDGAQDHDRVDPERVGHDPRLEPVHDDEPAGADDDHDRDGRSGLVRIATRTGGTQATNGPKNGITISKPAAAVVTAMKSRPKTRLPRSRSPRRRGP